MKGIPDYMQEGDPTTTFKYTVREYDSKNKIVVVDYDDGSWAKIPLYEPLPGDRDELEKYIRQFTDPIERELALGDETDMSFITDMVGKEYETGRRWMAPPPKPAPEPIEPDPQFDDIIAEEIGREKKNALVTMREMSKLVEFMRNFAYLNYPGVADALTPESRASVNAALASVVAQLKACQAAINEDRVLMVTVPSVSVEFVGG